jgi:hypothetical protein
MKNAVFWDIKNELIPHRRGFHGGDIPAVGIFKPVICCF